MSSGDDDETSYIVQEAPATFHANAHGRDAYIQDASQALLLPSHAGAGKRRNNRKNKMHKHGQDEDIPDPTILADEDGNNNSDNDDGRSVGRRSQYSMRSKQNRSYQQLQGADQQQQPPGTSSLLSPLTALNLRKRAHDTSVLEQGKSVVSGSSGATSVIGGLQEEDEERKNMINAMDSEIIASSSAAALKLRNSKIDSEGDNNTATGTDYYRETDEDEEYFDDDDEDDDNDSVAYEGYGSYNPTNEKRGTKNPEQIVFWDSAAQRIKENISGLRTWNGVFLPVTTNILGVVLFLKMPFVIAQCGLFLVLGLLIGCYFVSGMTTVSIAALSTNGFVGEGGPYYLASRVLGAANGVAVGISFLIGNLIIGSFFLTGSSNFALRVLHTDDVSIWATDNPYFSTISCSSVLLLILVFVALLGIADWFRIITLICIVVATFDIIATCFDDFRIGVHGLTGFSWDQMHNNLWPDYTSELTTAGAVGILFPSVSGILCGMTLSGEIRNASKGIPRGIGYSLIVTFIFYIVTVFFIAGSFDRTVLQLNEARSLMDVTRVYIYVPGALLSCFAAALSNLVGTSRVLYAMAQDNLMPHIRVFAFLKTLSKRECMFLSWSVMQIMILIIGTNYTAASVVASLVILSSYLALNVGCFLASVSGVVSFRPVYNFFSDWTALIAACSCFIGMFVIHPLGAATIICLHLICQFLVGTYMDPSKITWGDASQPLTFFLVRKLLLNLDERKEHIRHWRPSLLHIITDFEVSQNLIHFCNNLKKGGLYELAIVLEGDFERTAGSCHLFKRWMIDFLNASGMKAFALVTFGESVRAAVQQAIRGSGLGAMRPNSIMLSLDELDNQDHHRDSREPTYQELQMYNLHRYGRRGSAISSDASIHEGVPQRDKYQGPTEANLVRKGGQYLSLGKKYDQHHGNKVASKPNFSSPALSSANMNKQQQAPTSGIGRSGTKSVPSLNRLGIDTQSEAMNTIKNFNTAAATPASTSSNYTNTTKKGVTAGAGAGAKEREITFDNYANEEHDIDVAKAAAAFASINTNRSNTKKEEEEEEEEPSSPTTAFLSKSPTFVINALNKQLQERTYPHTRRDYYENNEEESNNNNNDDDDESKEQKQQQEPNTRIKKRFNAAKNEDLGNQEDVDALMKNLRLHRDICIYADGVDTLTFQNKDNEFAELAHDITHLHLNLFIARNFWKLDSDRLNTGNRAENPFYIDLISPDPSDAVIFLSAFCLGKTAVWKRVARLRVVDFVARSVDVEDAAAARKHMLKLRRIEAEVKVVALDELPAKAKLAIDKILDRRQRVEENDLVNNVVSRNDCRRNTSNAFDSNLDAKDTLLSGDEKSKKSNTPVTAKSSPTEEFGPSAGARKNNHHNNNNNNHKKKNGDKEEYEKFFGKKFDAQGEYNDDGDDDHEQSRAITTHRKTRDAQLRTTENNNNNNLQLDQTITAEALFAARNANISSSSKRKSINNNNNNNNNNHSNSAIPSPSSFRQSKNQRLRSSSGNYLFDGDGNNNELGKSSSMRVSQRVRGDSGRSLSQIAKPLDYFNPSPAVLNTLNDRDDNENDIMQEHPLLCASMKVDMMMASSPDSANNYINGGDGFFSPSNNNSMKTKKRNNSASNLFEQKQQDEKEALLSDRSQHHRGAGGSKLSNNYGSDLQPQQQQNSHRQRRRSTVIVKRQDSSSSPSPGSADFSGGNNNGDSPVGKFSDENNNNSDINSDVTEASRGSDIGNIRRALATPHQRSLIVNSLYKNYTELTDRTALVFARVPCFKAGKFTRETSNQWMRELRTISHGMPPMLMCCGEGALVSASDW